MNEELNASLATADELSREFDSLMKECAPNNDTPEVPHCHFFLSFF